MALLCMGLVTAACGGKDRELSQILLPVNVTSCLNDSFAQTSSATPIQLCLFLDGINDGPEGGSMQCALAGALPVCEADDSSCASGSSWLCESPNLIVEKGDTLAAQLFLVRGDEAACGTFAQSFDRTSDRCEGALDPAQPDAGAQTCLARLDFSYSYDGEVLAPEDAVSISHSGFVWETLGEFSSSEASGAVCPQIDSPPPGSAERCAGASCAPVPLTVSLEGVGLGSVTGGEFNCNKTQAGTETCTAQYPTGRVLSLAASADDGATFAGWGEGSCGSEAQCEITLDAAQTLQPTFGYTLSLAVEGQGAVTTPTPGFDGEGIDCRSSSGAQIDCPKLYVGGETVVLTADDTNGWNFASWSLAQCTDTSCAVTMTEPISVTATFGHRVSVALEGQGMVSSNPAGVMCPGQCTQAFQPGNSVQLSATRLPDQTTFHSWVGACENADAQCDLGVLMDSVQLTARFGYNLAVATQGPGTVQRSEMGIACDSGQADCRAYLPGAQVTLTAVPNPGANPGAVFVGWSEASCGTMPTCTVIADAARTVTANFEATYELQIGFSDAGAGQVEIVPDQGPARSCTAPGPCTELFNAGTQITINAQPDASAYFEGFSGACTGAGACQFTMDQARTLGVSLLSKFDLTVTLIGSGAGQVDLSPAPLPGTGAASCTSGTCVASYETGTVVNISDVAGAGAGFDQWEQDCTGSGACQVTMDQSRTVLARFVAQYDLNVNFVGQGAGTVNLNPPDQNCLSTAVCSQTYNEGEVVTVTAQPGGTAAFASWTTGPCTGSSNPVCVVTMNQAQTLTIDFVPLRALAVSFPVVAGQGSGTVEVTAPGQTPQTCASPTQCALFYPDGTQVTLTAMSAAGSTFDAWGGACAGTVGPACTLDMTQNRSASATFIREYTLSVTFPGAGAGQVQLTPPGATCTAEPCAQVYTHGTQVTLTPTPTAPNVFAGWGGACAAAGTGPCTLTLTADQSAIATFDPPGSDVTVVLGGDGVGTVNYIPGATCSVGAPQNCTQTVPFDSDLTLVASAQGGANTFGGWLGCPAPSGNSCTLNNVTAPITVTAQFFGEKTLTLDLAGAGRGSVTVSPGSNCNNRDVPNTCPVNTYDHGSSVTLTAQARNNSTVFTGWTGACAPAGTGPCTVTMDQDQTISALFEETGVDLTITGDGQVQLTTTTSSVTCNTPGCIQIYDIGEVVTLTAIDGTETFSSWTGACAATPGPICMITISIAHTVGAIFQ